MSIDAVFEALADSVDGSYSIAFMRGMVKH